MFPWIWLWSPNLHFPWSGSVAQRIDPDLLFNAISPSAGDADIERRAFHIASYGRQLGLITEVLLHAVDPAAIDPQRAADSLERLKRIRDEIEWLKTDDGTLSSDALLGHLARLRTENPAEFTRVLRIANG
ncbi:MULTISPECIES: hypothetical protein [Cupriavidus]|uniref:hypothetical protein n=1 Tax=Cupriavidus TaxID=106589 RepID=UPI000376E99E|nr:MULTISPECIES: hypothetical protein [Cupriavidus]